MKNKNIIGLASKKVKLLPHNPKWAELYRREEKIISSALGKAIKNIQHVGSTSIQGVNSKPIIDIAIGVNSLKDAEKCIKAMEKLGYEYKYYAGIRGRRFFAKGNKSNRTFYVHIEPINGRIWKNHILFRNYLRKHKESVKEYNDIKKLLVKDYKNDCETYTTKKDPFIKKILKKAKQEKQFGVIALKIKPYFHVKKY
ncbi:MAG: GrpB family protein [Candidatus Paceibacterota bacterium]